MKKYLLLTAVLFSGISFAGPVCTEQDKADWLDQKQFQTNLKNEGYNIKKFKVTNGNCYEIYAWDKKGKKVEIYFNPISGEIVKQK